MTIEEPRSPLEAVRAAEAEAQSEPVAEPPWAVEEDEVVQAQPVEEEQPLAEEPVEDWPEDEDPFEFELPSAPPFAEDLQPPFEEVAPQRSRFQELRSILADPAFAPPQQPDLLGPIVDFHGRKVPAAMIELMRRGFIPWQL